MNHLNNKLKNVFEEYYLDKITRMINEALADVGERKSWYYDINTNDVQIEIEHNINNGFIQIAVKQLDIIFSSLFNSYDELLIDSEIGIYVSILNDIVTLKLDDTIKQLIYTLCLSFISLYEREHFNTMYEERFLEIAVIVATKENQQELEEIIDFYKNDWNVKKFQMIHLSMLQRLSDEQTVDDFIIDHLDNDNIRLFAYHKAIENENYEEAEHLCLISVLNNNIGWLENLYETYAITNNTTKQIEIAEKLLLGVLSYYPRLKELLLQENLFKERYPLLLQTM